ncbi:polysaccharide biosynthesis/export family protein [Fibrobacter sp. UWB13]|jgi:polysaccharide export outer membrane protein|uniref:polysaccharide biosynthesis/export family protein n=1 Tax=Fibrobacter sp. UWB13 TaxID=1896204 RepID=UPI000A0C7FAD|nr:polysaccharide biosynthesis/export family protein [Fibrobacter sp. UWB13]MBQ3779330.1 polysaccharide biosynthesis/export family protein [Fibrobacter sp.]SMG42738.1 polysaccharide export outer membrane protein [Fibrobacter sp. UWB13]
MNKIGIALCGVAGAILSGCFAAPQMRMDVPTDSTTYNGITFKLHSIDNGEMGEPVPVAQNPLEGKLEDLMVDTLPSLEYRIGPLDQVQVVVWEHPELTSPMGQYQPAGQKVTTEGTLFYPYAGELKVEGLTAQELRKEITKRLSDKILNDPQVDVRVTGYHSRKAFVTGAVNRPGYVHFDENPMTIPDVIAEVGGFNEKADPSFVQLRRGDKVYNIDYVRAFKENIPIERILVKPDDQLFVPLKSEMERDRKVYVMGEVNRTSIVRMDNYLSLAEALTAAGGVNVLYAAPSDIYVIRNTTPNKIDVYQLNAKNAMALAMADRFELNPRDIVYVDASGLGTWNRLLSLIMPTMQAIYTSTNVVQNIQEINNAGWK